MSVNASPTAQSLVMAKKYEGRAGLIASVSDWMERLDCTTLYSSAEARLLEYGFRGNYTIRQSFVSHWDLLSKLEKVLRLSVTAPAFLFRFALNTTQQ